MSHACGKDFEMKNPQMKKNQFQIFLWRNYEMERPLLTVASAWQNSLTVVRTCL